MTVVEESVGKFRDALFAGIQGIVKAAEIYVAAIDDDPKAADLFRDQCADLVPASAWGQLEAVGRKWLHPRLIMGGMADRRKAACVKKLPYSLQERIFNRDRFPLLVSGGDLMQVDIMEATSEQVEQLCDGQAIRTIAEQKAYVEAKALYKRESPEDTEPMPYTIQDGRVHFRRGVSMTRSEIKRLLQEM